MSVFPAGFKSTKDISVPKRLLDQIIGQEKTVELITKAAFQKRNVLLVGEPGIGKSMVALAMTEILPVEKLKDILIVKNEADPNNPKVKTIKAGQGKIILNKTRLDAQEAEQSGRMFWTILPLLGFMFSWGIWVMGWISDIVYAAALILNGFLIIATVVGMNMSAPKSSKQTPKLLIDNSSKKVAPFFDGTGARAGALLGDVLHDPLQSFYGFDNLYVKQGESFVEKPFAELWSEMFDKYGKEIIRNKKGHEAIMLPPQEKIFTLGRKDGVVGLSRILSLNRQLFEGELSELNVGEKTISLTPEHKVFTENEAKQAQNISIEDKVFVLSKKLC